MASWLKRPKLGRAHDTDWLGQCIRCGQASKPHCLTDGELAERTEWQKHAEIAAKLMTRRSPGAGSSK